MEKTYNPISPYLAKAVCDLLADQNFKPAPLFPQAGNEDELFCLTRINEDGSCSIEFKE